MAATHRRPALGSVWVASGDYDPGRRIKITELLPEDAEKPSGVSARVLTSVSTGRQVLMSFTTLHENYEPGV